MPKLDLNFDNVSIEDGFYAFLIEKAKLTQPKDASKHPFISLNLVVEGGEKDGFKIQAMVSLSPNQATQKNLQTFLTAVTGDEWETGSALEYEDDGTFTSLVSQVVGGFVYTETTGDYPGIKIRMNSWIPAEEVPSLMEDTF